MEIQGDENNEAANENTVNVASDTATATTGNALMLVSFDIASSMRDATATTATVTTEDALMSVSFETASSMRDATATGTTATASLAVHPFKGNARSTRISRVRLPN